MASTEQPVKSPAAKPTGGKAQPKSGKPKKKITKEEFAKIVKRKPVVKITKDGRRIREGRPRNYELKSGIYRFSKSRTYHKKAKWKFIDKKHPKAPGKKVKTSIVKPVKGENNGGTRVVLLKRRRKNYPTTKDIKPHPSRGVFSKHKRYTRKSLIPGKVLILLAGRHKGKRVVLLKVLDSGLLLVTGPFKVNGCPLRRISQNYVIATSTKLDFSEVKVPEHLDDKYFRRMKIKKAKKAEGDIFATKKEKYVVTKRRKKDQLRVDTMVLNAIKKRKDRNVLIRYLRAMFGLRKKQCPHRIRF